MGVNRTMTSVTSLYQRARVLACQVCYASPAPALPSARPIPPRPTASPSSESRRRSAKIRRAHAGVRVRLRDVRGARAGRRRAAPGDVADGVREACGCARAPSACTRAPRSAAGARTACAVRHQRRCRARPPQGSRALLAAGSTRGADPNPNLMRAGMGASKKWKYTLRVENNNLQFLGLWMMQHRYHFTTAPRCGAPCRACPPRGPHARQFCCASGRCSAVDTLTWPHAVARPAAVARAYCSRWTSARNERQALAGSCTLRCVQMCMAVSGISWPAVRCCRRVMRC
jgi:hypothetical protein